jgi:hypothetical protein
LRVPRRGEEVRLDAEAARRGDQPLDAFAGVEDDQVIGRRLEPPLQPREHGLLVRRVAYADERAAKHRRAAAFEQAGEHVELASLGDSNRTTREGGGVVAGFRSGHRSDDTPRSVCRTQFARSATVCGDAGT